jgi:hypothetical protein
VANGNCVCSDGRGDGKRDSTMNVGVNTNIYPLRKPVTMLCMMVIVSLQVLSTIPGRQCNRQKQKMMTLIFIMLFRLMKDFWIEG